MDIDSTTIAKVKATVDQTITKKSDGNHTRYGFTGSLVELGNTYKRSFGSTCERQSYIFLLLHSQGQSPF